MMHRIPGLGLGLALLLGAQLAAAHSYRDALALAHTCTTDTSWVEPTAAGSDEWRAYCGDQHGQPLYQPQAEPSCWTERDSDGVTRTYCGSEEQHVCGLYAQWAYWACEHGYGEYAGSGSCNEAADEAVEECGSWEP